MTSNFVKTLILLTLTAALSACGGGGSDGGGGGGGGGGGTPPDNTPKCMDNNASNKGYALPCICNAGYLPNDDATACNLAGGGGDPGGGAGAPANLFYPQTFLTAQNGKPFMGGLGLSASVDNCTVSEPCTFTIAPALPFNLSINSSTGKITGTSSVLWTRRNHVVTATNSKGSTTITLSLAVVPDAPAISSISGGFDLDSDGVTEFYLQRNVGVGAINLTSTTSGVQSVVSYSIDPALPAGLTFQVDGGTGDYTGARIIGTPSVNQPLTTYTVTASGNATYGYPAATRQFQLAVESAPAGFIYDLSNVTSECIVNGAQQVECVFHRHVSFGNVLASLTSGNNLTFEIEQGIPGYQNVLPSGIELNTVTGNITTTDSGPWQDSSCGVDDFCNYRVKASNRVGSVTKDVRIKVLPPPAPTSVSYGGPYTFRRAATPADILPTFPEGQAPDCHGAVGCYTITPTITDIEGVNFSSATGKISVAPYVRSVKALTTYTVEVNVDTDTVTPGIQKLSTTFNLQALEVIPVFAYSYTDFIVPKGENFPQIEINRNSIPLLHREGVPDGLGLVLNVSGITPSVSGLNMSFIQGPFTTAPNSGGTIMPGAEGPSKISSDTYAITGCYGTGEFTECTTVNINLEVKPKIRGLAVGENHACAIEEGVTATDSPNKVLCWGLNDRGQLGHISTDTCGGQPCSKKGRYVMLGSNPLTHVSEIAAGKNHTCAIQGTGVLGDGRGKVYCWGDNSHQQISDSLDDVITTPTEVRFKVAGRCSSDQSSCIGYAADAIVTKATYLSLGDGDTCFIANGEVPAGSAVCPGGTAPGSCSGKDPYYMSEDVVHCLGKNYNSTVSANGKATKIGISTVNVNNSYLATSVGVGQDFACASTYQINFVISDPDSSTEINRERVGCWGKNDHGQLGRGTTDSNPFSVTIAPVVIGGSTPLSNVNPQDGLSVGGSFACINLKADAPSSTGNDLYCWGDNSSGQLARNNMTSSSVAVPMLDFSQTTGIAKSDAHASYKKGTVVGKVESSLYFSGGLPLFGAPYASAEAQILTPLKNTASTDMLTAALATPVKAPMAENSMCYMNVELFNGAQQTFLKCWGNGENGQLGNDSEENSVLPVRVKLQGL